MTKKLFAVWLIFAILSLAYVMCLTAGLAVNIRVLDEYEPPSQEAELLQSIEQDVSDGLDRLGELEQRLQELEDVFSRAESYEVTAYCETGNKTATGTVPQVGRTIAVDPRKIPYGSRVWIEGIGVRVAEDCGGAVKGNVIDLFVGGYEEAVQWGRRNRKAIVLAGVS